MSGIIAQKKGMTQIVNSDTGNFVPVTILEVPQNVILQIKTQERDGYESVVLGADKRSKESIKNVGKQYKMIREFPLFDGELKKGDLVSANVFDDGQTVVVSAVTKGRGFAGVIKRHNFARGRETHGSGHHREPGSSGMCAKPGRILKGKKMPGRYGTDKKTFRTQIVKIDVEKNLIAVKGGIPGAINSFVTLAN